MQITGSPRVDVERTARVPAAAAILLALAVGTFCYAPALRAFFAQDDFAFLALVRLLHQPWLLFVHDHFPASLYFRPLGVFVWWSVCALAGAEAWPQYSLNLAAHLGCVAALYALLQRMHRDAWLNALWAALLAAHPLAVGTALWLSDRFDLLTTLFSLLAVNAALAYAARPYLRTLALLLVALLCALLSKELGVVGSAAAFVTVALAPRRALNIRQRTTALAAIALLTLLWLAYRHAMLTPIPGMESLMVSPATFAEGAWRWLRTGLEFLARDPRMGAWALALLAVAAVLWLAAVIASRLGRRSEGRRWHVAAAVATLCLLPGFVQAPVAVHHLGDIDAQSFWFALIVASRFYHLAFAGLVCALMLASAPLVARTSQRDGPRLAIATALVLALIALAPATQGIAHAYASETRKQIAPLQAFEDALARTALPTRACQVYFLGAESIWGLAGYADAIAKGLAADPARIAHCLVTTERPAYTYFASTGSVRPEDYGPLRPLALAGNAVPWLTLGDVQAMYFTMGEDFASTLPPSAIFLEYRDGAFVDVSEAVRSGQRKVDFAIASPH
jgi:hypothetical protein